MKTDWNKRGKWLHSENLLAAAERERKKKASGPPWHFFFCVSLMVCFLLTHGVRLPLFSPQVVSVHHKVAAGGGTITLLGHNSGHAASSAAAAPATSGTVPCTGASMATVTIWALTGFDPATDAHITDSVGGNTYAAISPTATNGSSVLQATTFRSTGAFSSGAAQTFTATPTSGSHFAVSAACWTVVTTLDNAGTAGNLGNGTTCTTGATTASGSPSLFLSATTTNNPADTISPGGAFVLIERINAVGGTSVGGVIAWTTSGSTQTEIWNNNGSSQIVCGTYSFKM